MTTPAPAPTTWLRRWRWLLAAVTAVLLVLATTLAVAAHGEAAADRRHHEQLRSDRRLAAEARRQCQVRPHYGC
jgi:type II secretory pathway component PulL